MKVEDPAAKAEVERFLSAMDEDDDVQHIYTNLEA
jgi:transcriptional/translational regulatory protein YebC/TACO1